METIGESRPATKKRSSKRKLSLRRLNDLVPLNDMGKLVGRYFQALAWLSIASMVISPIFFSNLHIDISFILLFWAAGHLIRHNPTARTWTLRITGFIAAGIAIMLLYAAVAGTEGMTVSYFGTRIENPSIWQVAAVAGVLVVLVAIPIVLLLTPKARQEFSKGPRGSRRRPLIGDASNGE